MPIMRLLAILLAASSSLSFRCRATLSLFWLCWMRNTDRKSTRLNSSHGYISYAVFCLKKKTQIALTFDADRNLCGLFTMNESTVEQAALNWFTNLEFSTHSALALASDELTVEWNSFI